MSWSGMRRASAFRLVSCGITVLLVAAAVSPGASADDSLDHLREEFHRESDPVKRAKRFAKLGRALIAEMRKLESEKKNDAVAPLFQEYHDGATAAFDGLISSGLDAEKHPKGFRELEMHLRESVHELNDLLFGLPLDDREPLRKDLRGIESMDDRLLQALFPRNPEHRKKPPSSPAAHPLS